MAGAFSRWCGGWTADGGNPVEPLPQGCRVCIWWVLPDAALQVRTTGSRGGHQLRKQLADGQAPLNRCRRRRCRKWVIYDIARLQRCRRNKRSRGNVWNALCCWVNCRWTDGCVRCVKMFTPLLAAKRDSWPAVVVPADNLPEAQPGGIDVQGVRTLGQMQSWLVCPAWPGPDHHGRHPESAAGLADVGPVQARFCI